MVRFPTKSYYVWYGCSNTEKKTAEEKTNDDDDARIFSIFHKFMKEKYFCFVTSSRHTSGNENGFDDFDDNDDDERVVIKW